MLYEHHEKRLADQMKFRAKIAGAKIGKREEHTEKIENKFMFGDPKEYESLSEAEKKRKTADMMTFYKNQNFGIKTNA